jgi:hypothetical protein
MDGVKRPLPEICNEVLREVATRLGVTVGEIALVRTGLLIKTSAASDATCTSRICI